MLHHVGMSGLLPRVAGLSIESQAAHLTWESQSSSLHDIRRGNDIGAALANYAVKIS